MIQIAGLLLNGVFDFFKHRNQRKLIERQDEFKIKHAETKAKIQRIQSSDTAAINMDVLSANNRGWKADYLLLIVTIPLILSFIPFMVIYVTEGFEALEKVPEWYMWVLLGVFIDTFGFRRVLRLVLEKYISKKFN